MRQWLKVQYQPIGALHSVRPERGAGRPVPKRKYPPFTKHAGDLRKQQFFVGHLADNVFAEHDVDTFIGQRKWARRHELECNATVEVNCLHRGLGALEYGCLNINAEHAAGAEFIYDANGRAANATTGAENRTPIRAPMTTRGRP